MAVEGDCAYGVMAVKVRFERCCGVFVVGDLAGEGLVGQACGLAGLGFAEAIALAVED